LGGGLFKKGLNSWSARRIHAAVIRYRYLQELRENSHKKLLLGTMSLANLIIIIVSITTLSLVFSGSSVNSLVIFTNPIAGTIFSSSLLVTFMVGVVLLVLIYRDVFEAGNFEEYRAKTIAKLKKLGGKPEELDKIDREIEAEKQGG
jgi:hypothetical protein